MEDFRQQSPYLDPPQVHHDSDFKYTRFMSLSNLKSGSGGSASSTTNSVSEGTQFFPAGSVGMALFGIGRAGSIHLSNLLVNPRVELLYVVEADAARYEGFRSRWGVRMPPNVLPADTATVFTDPRVTAVLVATPTFTHCDIIRKALESGKMVFSEKPVAENEEQTRLCYQLAAEKNLSIFCAFNRRFDPSYRAIYEAVRRGEVGVVHRIKTVARDSPLPSIEYLKISGGIFHDCAVHDIDLICWVLGEYPTHVLAAAHAHIPEIAQLGDHDTVAITMKFASGAIGSVDISRNAIYGYDQRLEVFGPKGMLVADNERPVNVRRVTVAGDSSVPMYHSFPSRFFEGYNIELDAFLDHVQGGLLQEWTQCLRQATPAPPDEQLPYYGVFGAPATGQLILHLCRRLDQPTPVFFRALQLFERYMQAHLLEMRDHILTVDAETRQKEWTALLERIRNQAMLRMLSCIQIASKLSLHYKIFTTKRVKALLREAKHYFSLESVVSSEVRILKTLNFEVSPPTCLDTLETLLAELRRRQPALLTPLLPRLAGTGVRLLRAACVRRSQLYLQLYQRTTGRRQLPAAARRQFAVVLADRALLAAAVLLAAVFLLDAAGSDALLPPLAQLTQIPAADLLQLAELLLRALLPGLDAYAQLSRGAGPH